MPESPPWLKRISDILECVCAKYTPYIDEDTMLINLLYLLSRII